MNESLKKNRTMESNSSMVNAHLGVYLINILNKISVSTSFENFCELITKLIIIEIEDISRVLYYLVDREIEIIQCLGKVNKYLQFTAGNKNEYDIEIIQDFQRGILGATVQSGAPTTISNHQMERFDENEICIPIIFDSETIGLIHVIRSNALQFKEGEQKKLEYIANTLGSFIKSKLLTQQLQRSETKLRASIRELRDLTAFQEEIMRSMNEGLVIEDENLNIIYLNPKAEEGLGYTKEELYKQNYATIVADNSIFDVHKETKKQKTGLRSSYRANLLRKDQSEIPVLIHSAPFWKNNMFKGIIMVFTDLSRFVQIEEEILWLKGHHQRILDNLLIGIIGISIDKRINYTNKYFRSLTSTTIYGKTYEYLFSNVFTGPASSSVLSAIEESFLEHRGLRINEIPFALNGNNFVANLSLIPLFGHSEEFIGAVLVIEDDTAAYTLIDRLRKAYNELEDRQDRLVRETAQRTEFQRKLMERTKELRQKHSELESFVYSISHDLKTPIVSIQGYLGALIEDMGGTLNSGINFYIERILKNTDHVKRLILDILEYSQLGQEKVTIETLESLETILQAIEQVESQEKFRDFQIRIEKGPYPKIVCQPLRIIQVFFNLIYNAWKYRDKNKRNPSLRISLEEEEKYWIFVFSDNGVGIPDSNRDRIFVMFERAHLDPDDDVEGSGIGLAFSKKIIEIHNGRITVNSVIGEGSTFRVWLPKKPSIQKNRLF
ncbi:MAG: ATP-binding protein [Candidatus Hermodarchaeota archaeon]